MNASSAGPEGGYSIVLGAGGRPGLAYHAGTLLALELHGFTAAGASSITGTSAGSIATALLVAGGTVEDLAAYTVGASPRIGFEAMDALIRAADDRRLRLDVSGLRHLVDVRRTLAAAGHLRARRFVAALAALVPGFVEIRRRFDFLDGASVPVAEPSLWRIVAADLRGGRHVFTAGQAPLSLAVAASCAVPGLFTPVRHGARTLIDGGVHSTTNADLAADDPTSTVIVLAPMCDRATTPRPASSPDATLAAEVAALESSGRRVVTFRPSAELRRAMGRNPLAVARSREITAAALLEATDVLGTLAPRRRVAA